MVNHTSVYGTLDFVFEMRFNTNIRYEVPASIIDKITDKLPTINIPIE